ncbi:MAG: DUF4296 domain-containing protein [Polaribacter sp.]
MKKISYIFLLSFLFSCTSNTIFKKPKDLIPKDTMRLLLQDMMIASSAKYTRNKFKKNNINYMPFVFDKFKIDSARFQESNLYYMSKIDVYQKILDGAKKTLEEKKEYFKKRKQNIDSIKNDSLEKVRKFEMKMRKDTLQTINKKRNTLPVKDILKEEQKLEKPM